VFSTGAAKAGSNTSSPVSSAGMMDAITISGPGTSVLLTMTLEVGGTISLQAPAPAVPGMYLEEGVSSDFSLGGAQSGTASNSAASVHILTTDSNGAPTQTTMNASKPGVVANLDGYTITLQLTVQVGEPIEVSASLGVISAGTTPYGETTDYGHTGRIAVSLPAGYTFTSASGVFLSQAGAPGLPLDGGTYPIDLGASAANDLSVSTSGGTNGGVHGSSKSGGCSATGAPAAPPWAILLLVAALIGRRCSVAAE
jgi:uncharacterized protein (TIGR03382 family)